MSAGDPMGFGARLDAAIQERGPLCVGIDPHPGLLRDWSLPDDAAGLGAFSHTVLDAVGPFVAAVKPQSAFFERHGAAGIAVLEGLVRACREAGVLCIIDAKRGDIGSTMDAYADAYLRAGASLAADAVTLSPYLGFGTLEASIDVALAHGRGVFVLALTSNPEGRQVQHARDEAGVAVAARIARMAAARNAAEGASLGSVGLVVGATVGSAPQTLGLALEELRGPILAPGIGAQGGGAADLRTAFGAGQRGVLASASRSVLGAGPQPEALRTAAQSLTSALTGTGHRPGTD